MPQGNGMTGSLPPLPHHQHGHGADPPGAGVVPGLSLQPPQPSRLHGKHSSVLAGNLWLHCDDFANLAVTVTPNKAASVQTQMPLTEKVHE